MNILDAIGNTPLVELKRVVPPGAARVMATVEWANPTGSMKDRMARAAVEGADNFKPIQTLYHTVMDMDG